MAINLEISNFSGNKTLKEYLDLSVIERFSHISEEILIFSVRGTLTVPPVPLHLMHFSLTMIYNNIVGWFIQIKRKCYLPTVRRISIKNLLGSARVQL